MLKQIIDEIITQLYIREMKMLRNTIYPSILHITPNFIN